MLTFSQYLLWPIRSCASYGERNLEAPLDINEGINSDRVAKEYLLLGVFSGRIRP